MLKDEELPLYKDTQLTQLQMFEFISEEVNYEEERLQLWMMMT